MITLSPDQLGVRLRADQQNLPKVIKRAMKSAAARGRGNLVAASPTDRGILRNAWKLVEQIDGVLLQNDQPYAGVVERGARPFRISPEGLEALKGWVYRKLLLGTKARGKKKKVKLDAEAESIAQAIAHSFERSGIRGKRFVQKILPQLASLIDAEVIRYLTEYYAKP